MTQNPESSIFKKRERETEWGKIEKVHIVQYTLSMKQKNLLLWYAYTGANTRVLVVFY